MDSGHVISVLPSDWCRRDNEHADLYHVLPWSHGSLGFLTSLTLTIIPVKQFIHMRSVSTQHIHMRLVWVD